MEFNAEVVVSKSRLVVNSTDLERLGIDELVVSKELKPQPNYLSGSEVTAGNLEIPIVGPCRFYSQLVLTQRDADILGIEAPVRMSGRLWETPDVKVKNGDKEVEVPVIIQKRHIHMSPELARELGVKESDHFMAYVNEGKRRGILANIEVFIEPKVELVLHIDEEEANAFGINTGDLVIIRKDDQSMFVEDDEYDYMRKYFDGI